jgi:hypothetical protein
MLHTCCDGNQPLARVDNRRILHLTNHQPPCSATMVSCLYLLLMEAAKATKKFVCLHAWLQENTQKCITLECA